MYLLVPESPNFKLNPTCRELELERRAHRPGRARAAGALLPGPRRTAVHRRAGRRALRLDASKHEYGDSDRPAGLASGLGPLAAES